MLIRVVILVLLCVAVFGPTASADAVAATPVDGAEVVQSASADAVAATPVDAAEDAQLQELQAQTSQDVEDIQGGLSKAWGIVGVVLVAIIVVSVIL